MGNVIRAAITGYNAFTETDLDRFSLYTDEDNVLIKEKARGSISLATGGNQPIAHGLSYVPFVIAFYEISTGVWRKLIGDDEFNGEDVYLALDTTNLTIYNFSGASVNLK